MPAGPTQPTPSDNQRVTRLAPSPTGALHLGNALTFLTNWALARRLGWRIVLRIEDLDGPRIKQGSDGQAIDLLRWLGIDWDGGPTYQSADLAPYRQALESLAQRGLIYPSDATRSQIEAALSAPHEGDHELRYPGINRPAGGGFGLDADTPPLLEDDDTAWRLVVPDEAVCFVDQVLGERRVNVQRQVGDFVVATKAGLPAYQLAVVVDDARQGVTDVVRGSDLVDSTARQLLLYRHLVIGPVPAYYHLPLVYGVDGLRLAKRHGDTRLVRYREQGIPAQRVVGLLAYWAGLVDRPEPMDALAFARLLEPDRLPSGSVTFTPEHEQWLQAGSY
ncbi:MAG: glutamate--tRNA ligase family protein [Planctomycetota bacterium]